MLARTSAIREYSSVLRQTYKHLCSADGSLTPDELQKCYDYAKKKVKYPIDIVERPCTVEDFKMIIHDYMKHHKVTRDGEDVYTKTLITVDHSLLFRKDNNE